MEMRNYDCCLREYPVAGWRYLVLDQEEIALAIRSIASEVWLRETCGANFRPDLDSGSIIFFVVARREFPERSNEILNRYRSKADVHVHIGVSSVACWRN